MSDSGEGLDATIGEFVELEEELTTGVATAGTYEEGTVAGAAKMPADRVPEDYPVAVPTEHALRLDVQTDDGVTLQTFLPWPEPGSDTRAVADLLAALGLSPSEFANLYGEQVALRAEQGWHCVDVAATGDVGGRSDRSRTRSRPGVSTLSALAAATRSLDNEALTVPLAVVLGVLGAALLDTGAAAVGGILTLLAWLLIPGAVYNDVRGVEEKIGWNAHVTNWLRVAWIPFANIGVGAAYLLERLAQASDSPAAAARLRKLWVGAATGLSLLSVLLVADSSAALASEAVLFVAAGVLLPFTVYFDAGTVGEVTDWDPNVRLWAVLALVANLLFSAFLVGGAYLLVRSGK